LTYRISETRTELMASSIAYLTKFNIRMHPVLEQVMETGNKILVPRSSDRIIPYALAVTHGPTWEHSTTLGPVVSGSTPMVSSAPPYSWWYLSYRSTSDRIC